MIRGPNLQSPSPTKPRLATVTSIAAHQETRADATAFESYSTLLNRNIIVPSQKTEFVAVEKNHFVAFLEPHVARILVDEAWYLAQYPDVREAVECGDVGDAAEHYRRSGYYEHRMPYAIEVDEAWYLAQYADVRDAVAQGVFVSGIAHFYEVGFREGRLPYAHFTFKPAR